MAQWRSGSGTWMRRAAVRPDPIRWRSIGRVAWLGGLAVLLGRASIAGIESPFALAYCVVLTELLGPRVFWVLAWAVVGAYWHGGWAGATLCAGQMTVYWLCRQAASWRTAPDLHWLPFLAGLVAASTRFISAGAVWTRYDVLTAVTEGGLVVILSFIFFQCLPALVGTEPNKSMRHEQWISLTIFVGSVTTGLSGIAWHGVTAVQIAIDWTVLLMATVGGVGISTSVAVVVGILALLDHAQSLSTVAVLAFGGLLAGVLKEAGRLWLGLAFLVSISLLSAGHGGSWASVEGTMIAAAVAWGLLLLVPYRYCRALASYVPGTVENRVSEQERGRRIRIVLSERIHDMSQVFDELAVTFADSGENTLMSAQQLLTHIVGTAASTVCHGCPRHEKCWDKESYATYQAMAHTVEKMEANESRYVTPTQDLKDRCIRIDAMMSVLRNNVEVTERDARWIAKLQEQKSLVAAQLSGVANVIRNVAAEIDRDNESSIAGEEQILSALEQLGLYVDHVHIVSLQPGKIEVEITQPSAGAYENSIRVIAPLLSGIVGENITVAQVNPDEPGPCTSVFASARLYDVDTAAAAVAREGRVVSGDTHTAADLGNGRFAVALSDGMGNGERARRESKAAIELLKKLLTAGFDEQLAIQTVNSTLLLRSPDEMFTTLDMVLIDLFSAHAEFLKIGSAPSFLKRGRHVRAITGANVPIGILQDIEVQSIADQLADGDILILLSDGVYDAPAPTYDRDDWLTRQIELLETSDPQAIADTLIESAVRQCQGQIRDDMTVLVAQVRYHHPDWAAIKLPGVVGIRQDKQHRRRGA